MKKEETTAVFTLGDALRILLCGCQPSCGCREPIPITYYCVYGTCTIYRCRKCSGVIHRVKGYCNFPRSK